MSEKSDVSLLAHLFCAEVEGRIHFQSRGQWLERLQKKGYIQPMFTTLPGRFPVTVRDWQLTHLGRITYCASCNEPSMNKGRE